MTFLSLPMRVCQGVSRRAIVSSNQKPVLICLVCHLKSRVLSVLDVPIKVFQVNSQHDVIRSCQTVKIVVSKPELAVQISKSVFVRFPSKIEVNRAVQTSLKNGPTSTVRGHVTQHLHWFAAIWIDGIHATGIETIWKPLGAAFQWFCKEERRNDLELIRVYRRIRSKQYYILLQGFPV